MKNSNNTYEVIAPKPVSQPVITIILLAGLTVAFLRENICHTAITPLRNRTSGDTSAAKIMLMHV